MATIKLGSSKSATNSLNYCEKKAEVSSGLNCYPNLAKEQFKITRQFWGKENGRQAHTIIQAFRPGETNPHQANEIGLELAKQVAPEHEIVVYTHIDTNHIHNHIVINAVNFETGKKYHSKPEDLHKIRDISDRLCKAHGLSIATDFPANLRYTLAESEIIAKGHPGWKHEIRRAISCEIDAIQKEIMVSKSNFHHTLENAVDGLLDPLKSISENQLNFTIKSTIDFLTSEAYNKFKYNLFTKYGIIVNDDRKYITFQHPDGQKISEQNPTAKGSAKKIVRGKTLGTDYDRDGIHEAIRERAANEITKFLRQRQQHQGAIETAERGTENRIHLSPIQHSGSGHDETIIRPIQNRDREHPPQNSLDTIQRELRRINETVFSLTSDGRRAEIERQRRSQVSDRGDRPKHPPNEQPEQTAIPNPNPQQPTIPKPTSRSNRGLER